MFSILINQAKSDFGSQDEFTPSELRFFDHQIWERKRFVIAKPDPEHIERQHDPLVPGVDEPHQSETKIRQQISGRGMHADVAAERSDSSVHPREPQIRADRKMPSAVFGRQTDLGRSRGSRVGCLRGCRPVRCYWVERCNGVRFAGRDDMLINSRGWGGC